jgi:peptidase M28-like protein
VSGAATGTTSRDEILRETIEALAPMDRGACSPGEREAAEWLARRLEAAGADARVEEELAYSSYARPLFALSLIGIAAGILAGRRGAGKLSRLLAFAGGAGAAAAIADDVSNHRRWFRGLTMEKQPTWNVVAECGERGAEKTLVILAHHDAAQSGFIFDQGAQRMLYERYPEMIEKTDTSIPLWWPVVGGPALAALGALTGRRGLARAGALLSVGSAASFGHIASSPVVPGANDNLSGCAVLVAVAEELRENPVPGLRVILASCGSEEVLQGGIHGFAERHFPSLPPESTWVINHDSVGSPHLVILEGEGPMKMEDFDPAFRDLVADVAERSEIPMRRGLRARLSTDSVIPHRHGYPVASLCSVNEWKAVSNYHWASDVPENLDYTTIADAAELTVAVAQRLARP